MSRREQQLLRWVLVIACGLFLAGLWFPIATIEQFYIFDSTVSVLSGLWELAVGNQIPLFVLILSFSVILPLLKMVVLWRILFSRASTGNKDSRWVQLMHDYGRWSMLDVFVVAMLVVGVKLTAVADIETHLGLYLFCAGILAIMAVTGRVARWH